MAYKLFIFKTFKFETFTTMVEIKIEISDAGIFFEIFGNVIKIVNDKSPTKSE